MRRYPSPAHSGARRSESDPFRSWDVVTTRYSLGGRRGEPAIGHNERYSDYFDGLMGGRILQRVATSGELQSLTPAELRLDQVALTIDPKPRRTVKAWVRFGATPIRVDAVVARWTPDAVGILFDVNGKQMRCWVWAGAVEETT